MKRIKILFVILIATSGGVEKSLVNLLKNIDKKIYDCEVLLLKKEGSFLSDIEKQANVKEMDLDDIYKTYLLTEKIPSIKEIKGIKNRFKVLFLNAIHQLNRITKKIFHKKTIYYFIYNKIKNVDKDYDIVIDFMGYASFSTYYAYRTGKHIAVWIHEQRINKSYRELRNCYKKTELICPVCEECAQLYLSRYPVDSNKVRVINNLIDVDEIKRLSEMRPSVDYFNEEKVFVSVGRLSKQKSFEKAIEAAKIMKEAGYKFKWVIIGEGDEKEFLEEMIKDYNLENTVVLHGFDSNPYTYMKNAYVYVQTSIAEGKCTTISEAVLLGKAVVTTDVAGAEEQLCDGKGGVIVTYDSKEIANALMQLMDNPEEINKYENFNSNATAFNNVELYKFNQCMEDLVNS